jgi:hypothetical protein
MDLSTLMTYRMDLADEEDEKDMDWDMTATAAATVVVRGCGSRWSPDVLISVCIQGGGRGWET